MSTLSETLGANSKEWAQAADSAKEAAASVGNMAQHAVSAAAAKADELTANAGVGIQGLGDRLGKSAPQTGVLGSASQAVARGVKEGGKYIEDAKISGITENMAQLIRRHPIPAVLLGIGLGWLACRKLKG
jgi:hypothetical protein